MIKLMVIGYFIGCICYSGQWLPKMGVGCGNKTVLHRFRKVVVEFVFKKLKQIFEPWE